MYMLTQSAHVGGAAILRAGLIQRQEATIWARHSKCVVNI